MIGWPNVAAHVSSAVFVVILPSSFACLPPRLFVRPGAIFLKLLTPHRIGLESERIDSGLEKVKVKGVLMLQEIRLSDVATEADAIFSSPDRILALVTR